MKHASVLVLLLLAAACGRNQAPRVDRLHAAPFQYLSDVQLGMREKNLLQARTIQRVGPGEYFETVASYGVVYVTANRRLIGLIVAERFASGVAANIAFTQHQQEAYRSLGVAPQCRFDAQEHRRIALFQLQHGVHEISLHDTSPVEPAQITRSWLLAPSVQWRRARQQSCNG